MTTELLLRSHPTLIHVAAADESRGRIIVALSGNAPDPLAVRAALDLASAYDSAIEGIYVENTELFQAAAHPFVRQVLLSGRIAPNFDAEHLASDIFTLSRSTLRKLEHQIAAAGKHCTTRSLRAHLDTALAVACAENGPWNIVVLGDAITSSDVPQCVDILKRTAGLTAIWTTPAKAENHEGAIVLVIDQDDNLQQMLRVAERLRSVQPSISIPISILILGYDKGDLEDREGRMRLALAMGSSETAPISIEQTLITRQEPSEIEDAIARHNPRLVIAQTHTFSAIATAYSQGRSLNLPYQLLIVR